MSNPQNTARSVLVLANLLIQAMAEGAEIDLDETMLHLTTRCKDTGGKKPVTTISGGEVLILIAGAIAELDAELDAEGGVA